jgi:hypothetical protein
MAVNSAGPRFGARRDKGLATKSAATGHASGSRLARPSNHLHGSYRNRGALCQERFGSGHRVSLVRRSTANHFPALSSG